jgi:hypothetical protein
MSQVHNWKSNYRVSAEVKSDYYISFFLKLLDITLFLFRDLCLLPVLSSKQRIQLAGNDNVLTGPLPDRKRLVSSMLCYIFFEFYNLKVLNRRLSSLSNRYRRTHWAHILWFYHHTAAMITKASSSNTAISSEKFVPSYLLQTYHGDQNQNYQIPTIHYR